MILDPVSSSSQPIRIRTEATPALVGMILLALILEENRLSLRVKRSRVMTLILTSEEAVGTSKRKIQIKTLVEPLISWICWVT